MEEQGILFSGPMVRATLDDRKTQTRRVGKDQVHRPVDQDERGWYWQRPVTKEGITFHDRVYVRCPYGVPGDRLWVREEHALIWPESCDDGFVYDDDNWEYGRPIRPDECTVEYRADTDAKRPGGWPDDEDGGPRWRPSIHMHRCSSRINLDIVDVRVERVQEITREDGMAEGLSQTTGDHVYDNRTTVENFAVLWDSLNAKRGFGWDANPWVWVIEFKRSNP